MDRFELYYQVMRSHLQEQEIRRRAIELKAGSVMTLGVTLLGIAGLIVTLFSGEEANLPLFSLISAALMLIAFLFLFGFSLVALWSTDWEIAPVPNDAQAHISNPDIADSDILLWASESMSEAHASNLEILEDKAVMAKWSMIALSAEVGFLTLLAMSLRF